MGGKAMLNKGIYLSLSAILTALVFFSVNIPDGNAHSDRPGVQILASSSPASVQGHPFKTRKFKFRHTIKKKNGKMADSDLSKAMHNYGSYCSPCHGDTGEGNGPLADTLDTPPRNHTDADIMSTRTDQEIFDIIYDGGAAHGFSPSMMAQKGLLPKKEVWELVHYIRKLCHCRYES